MVVEAGCLLAVPQAHWGVSPRQGANCQQQELSEQQSRVHYLPAAHPAELRALAKKEADPSGDLNRLSSTSPLPLRMC